jgi:hypothetical protein
LNENSQREKIVTMYRLRLRQQMELYDGILKLLLEMSRDQKLLSLLKVPLQEKTLHLKLEFLMQ